MTLSEVAARTIGAPPVARLREILGETTAWVVGGTVRDIALGREVGDLDLAVEGSPKEPARRIAKALGGVAFELSDEFPAWRARGREGEWQVDVARLRGGSLMEDLSLRDFTLGAVAVDLATGLGHDPLGGLPDLQSGTLRACSDRSFVDDPLRLMRAARFASQFGWTLDDRSASLARAEAPRGAEPAGERILAELCLLAAGRDPVAGFACMDRIGLFDSVLPEIGALHGVVQGPNHHLDVYGHTIEVLEGVLRIESELDRFVGERAADTAEYLAQPLADGVSRGTGLRLAALFHDCAKPPTRKEEDGFVSFRGHDRLGAEMIRGIFGGRLKSSRKLRDYLAALTRDHLVLGFMVADMPLDRRRVYRYLKRTEPNAVDVTLLTVADRLAARGTSSIAGREMVAGHLELAREMIGHGLDWDREGPPTPLIGGVELAQELQMKPGPKLGELLDELAAARYAGEIETAGEAVEHARRVLEAE